MQLCKWCAKVRISSHPKDPVLNLKHDALSLSIKCHLITEFSKTTPEVFSKSSLKKASFGPYHAPEQCCSVHSRIWKSFASVAKSRKGRIKLKKELNCRRLGRFWRALMFLGLWQNRWSASAHQSRFFQRKQIRDVITTAMVKMDQTWTKGNYEIRSIRRRVWNSISPNAGTFFESDS